MNKHRLTLDPERQRGGGLETHAICGVKGGHLRQRQAADGNFCLLCFIISYIVPGGTAADVRGEDRFSEDARDPLICPWGRAQMLWLGLHVQRWSPGWMFEARGGKTHLSQTGRREMFHVSAAAAPQSQILHSRRPPSTKTEASAGVEPVRQDWACWEERGRLIKRTSQGVQLLSLCPCPSVPVPLEAELPQADYRSLSRQHFASVQFKAL